MACMAADDAQIVRGVDRALAFDDHFLHARLDRDQDGRVHVVIVKLQLLARALIAHLPVHDPLPAGGLRRKMQSLQSMHDRSVENIASAVMDSEAHGSGTVLLDQSENL